jgi:hypothetical protein
MRGRVFLAVSAMAGLAAFAQPASAQQYPTYHDAHVANQQCQQSRNNRTVGGALIGGVLGAILGHNVAGGHGSRDEGTALGAVAGAVAGGAIGRNTARCEQVQQGAYDPYYGQSYRQDQPYYDDDLEGGPYQESGYYGDDYYDRDCRMGQVITRDPYGREYRDNVMMCRGSDGVWRPQN